MKFLFFILLVLIIALSGCVDNIKIVPKVGIEYVVNNTDLYETGERLQGVNYTANNSAIQLMLIFHVIGNGASQVFDTNLSINGTVISDRDFRTTAGAGIHEHFSMITHIPKHAVYNVTNTSNVYDIEWREYLILSGRNGTLSIVNNITQTGNGSQNLSAVLLQGNDALNKSIENVTSINLSNQINVGSNYEYSDDAVINIRRNVDDTSSIIHGHGFADNSVVTRNISSNGGVGYNSFDSLPTISAESNHYAGFQARPNMINATGTNMTTFYGFYTYPVMSKYNLSTFYGLKIFNPAFSNDSNINNSYGIYIESQTNTTNFYPLVAGNGKVGLGTYTPRSQFQINSTNNSIGYLEPIFTMYDSKGILRTRLYEAGLQQWYLNNSGTETGLIAFGFPGGSPGLAILNGSLGNRQDLFIDSTNGGWRLNTGSTSGTPPDSFYFDVPGDLSLLKTGGGINIKEGYNARMGVCTLSAGACVVSTTQVTANSRIFVTSQADGGTPGFLRITTKTAGSSFTITSSNGADTSTVAWIIIDPS